MAKVRLIESTPNHRRVMKRWKLPAGHSVREFVMRELDSADDITAAINADKFGGIRSFDNLETAMQVLQRERVRLALVEVDGRRVNTEGLPYKEFDTWSLRTTRLAERAYLELNNLSSDEVESFDKGGELIEPANLAPLDLSTAGPSDD